MNLPVFSIRRPITVIMLILMIVLIGSVSLSELKLDLLPNLNVPMAVVTAKYEGAGPREIENFVTKPFEEALTAISNLKSIETVSTSEHSLCILYFNDETDMNFATLEMREKIDLAKPWLPQGVKDIMVMRIDPNSFHSTLEIGISSNMKLEDMTRLVEDQILNKLERINGVASVTIFGGLIQEIRIELVPERLALYGLNENAVSQYIMSENLDIPSGSIESAGRTIYLKTSGKLGSIDEIRNLSMPTATGTAVLLDDLANISLANREMTSESFINGRLSLNLSVQKQSSANAVQVCRAVREEISRLEDTYSELNFDIIYDSSAYIDKSIESVTESAVKGGILSVLILYLFLRNVRATLIIAVSMPISIVTSFVLMYFSGISLNLISMAGFALGIGMLVDNSIVVLENIYRHRHEGRSILDAAEIGTKEVMLSITASTLTTIAVFIPIVFVEGLTGKIFKEMGLIITFSLMASLLIAITFLPMMASRILSIEPSGARKKKTLWTRVFDLWSNLYARVCRGYKKLLLVCIKRRVAIIGIAAFMLLLSLISVPVIGFEYFPAMDEGLITVEIMLPKGSALSETHDMAFKVQEYIRKVPEVQGINIIIGNSGFVLDRSTSEKATLTVNVGSINNRRRGIKQISDEIRKNLANISGAKIKVADDSKVMGFSIDTEEVDIRITGEDMEKLKEISDELLAVIGSIDGIRDASSSIHQQIEEAVIRIDRNKAAIYGLTTLQVGQAVQSHVRGIVPSRYQYRGSDIDIVVSSSKENVDSIEGIKNIAIQSPRGVSVPLSEIAEINMEKSFPAIIRNDQKKSVSITADIHGRAINKITKDIDKAFSKYEFPPGYSYSYDGRQKDLIDSFNELFKALVLSIIIVYMLLAAQFESLIQPFIILLTVPLALTGGLVSLLITGKTLSIPAFIGVIILVGIVVDNAIVLVDIINRFRQEGLSREEAINKAGPLRLRPILMTTLTTILGMLPMAVSRNEGSEIQAPLAVVVIGGLAVSTFVTLIVIPSFYLLFERNRDRQGRRLLQ